ncbi:hypothetical protein [Micromonospora sp. HK10]|uniref:hypothetical protein n=1 Tax=Micromonospora sp. HK10 TaxID=1538294 RepID=UPI001E3BAF6E|nr:hypothetical protein [Micromonospora sp. HK10]
MQEVIRRYWNGVWGRLARRDVWLVRQTRWMVVARAGDTETGKVLRWEFDAEPEAVRMVERLLRADTAGQWREQTGGRPLTPPRRSQRPESTAAE